jgi:DNA helicase HerA-like ATPase
MLKMKPIGIVLTGATTDVVSAQLLEPAEKGGSIREGKFLVVERGFDKQKILARVSSLVPQNDFYVAGDAWTESRRKGTPIPSELARQFVVCELELLAEIPGARRVSVPPFPNDEVFELTLPEQSREVFGLEANERGIVWYGSLLGYTDAPVPLDVEKIPMHMGVFGITGSGKSYDTGALLEKLVKIRISEDRILAFPMLIVDANGDYLDYVEHFEKKHSFGAASAVTHYVFPKSPDLGKHGVKSIGIDLNQLNRRDLAEAIMLFYSGGEKNELQVAGLDKIISILENESYISEHDYQSIFTNDETFDKAKKLLRRQDLDLHSGTQAAIGRALDKFKMIEDEKKLFGQKSKLDLDFIENLSIGGEISIVDFSERGAPGIEPTLKQFVVSYLSSILFAAFTRYKIEGIARYLIFVIEEAQNYCPNVSTYAVGYSLAREKLSAIATQGRKFGLSLCLISQRPSFVDPVILSMCNTFFIHRISPEDTTFVRKVTGGLPNSLERRLTTMENGELVITGQMLRLPFPVVVKVPPREIPQTRGRTDVLLSLEKNRRGP